MAAVIVDLTLRVRAILLVVFGGEVGVAELAGQFAAPDQRFLFDPEPDRYELYGYFGDGRESCAGCGLKAEFFDPERSVRRRRLGRTWVRWWQPSWERGYRWCGEWTVVVGDYIDRDGYGRYSEGLCCSRECWRFTQRQFRWVFLTNRSPTLDVFDPESVDLYNPWV